MMRKIFIIAALVGMTIIGVVYHGANQKHFLDTSQVPVVSAEQSFELNRGDILVRPNWGWLPGSAAVAGGRKFGHVALVVVGAKGESPEDALRKSVIIEALIYDQAKSGFELNREKQIREADAFTSFGNKFAGIRYRLRPKLEEAQIDTIIAFLRKQLDGGYGLFTNKLFAESQFDKQQQLSHVKNSDWHCATLVWEAVYLAAGLDLDGNGGKLVYPSDIIVCRLFDCTDGRVRF